MTDKNFNSLKQNSPFSLKHTRSFEGNPSTAPLPYLNIYPFYLFTSNSDDFDYKYFLFLAGQCSSWQISENSQMGADPVSKRTYIF
jgi:hypothetical protein